LKKVNLEQTNFGAEAHAEGPLAETKRKKWGKKRGAVRVREPSELKK